MLQRRTMGSRTPPSNAVHPRRLSPRPQGARGAFFTASGKGYFSASAVDYKVSLSQRSPPRLEGSDVRALLSYHDPATSVADAPSVSLHQLNEPSPPLCAHRAWRTSPRPPRSTGSSGWLSFPPPSSHRTGERPHNTRATIAPPAERGSAPLNHPTTHPPLGTSTRSASSSIPSDSGSWTISSRARRRFGARVCRTLSSARDASWIAARKRRHGRSARCGDGSPGWKNGSGRARLGFGRARFGNPRCVLAFLAVLCM